MSQRHYKLCESVNTLRWIPDEIPQILAKIPTKSTISRLLYSYVNYHVMCGNKIVNEMLESNDLFTFMSTILRAISVVESIYFTRPHTYYVQMLEQQ